VKKQVKSIVEREKILRNREDKLTRELIYAPDPMACIILEKRLLRVRQQLENY